jgi:flavin-dependent dehydrogenase
LNSFDAVIIGGGPAGATAALLLAKAGWSVILFEKASFPRRKVCGEYLSPTNFALLNKLGVSDHLLSHAGPEVRKIELLWRSSSIIAGMPYPEHGSARWGRAVRREVLDTLLLKHAKKAGVTVRQPFSVVDIRQVGEVFISQARSKRSGDTLSVQSSIVIAAHGSWAVGNLPTQLGQQPVKSSDLLGFKIYLENAFLPSDVMNMIVVPGAYAGMVTCDQGLVSLSCCIRRDYLQKLRNDGPGEKAGPLLYKHILKSCPGLDSVVNSAHPIGEWLAAGPIRPGIRHPYKAGVFLIGNAAGEAHPTIADGISMAMQSAWLLANILTQTRPSLIRANNLNEIGLEFTHRWLKAFRLRIRAAEVFARMSMLKRTHRILLPVLRTFPKTLTVGARLGGIAEDVVGLQADLIGG